MIFLEPPFNVFVYLVRISMQQRNFVQQTVVQENKEK